MYWTIKTEKDTISIDTPIADLDDILFLKYVKTLKDIFTDANLFEGQIRGHTFIDKKNNVESSWGEKLILELKRFHHDDIGDIKDSFLYIYTGQSLISNNLQLVTR